MFATYTNWRAETSIVPPSCSASPAPRCCDICASQTRTESGRVSFDAGLVSKRDRSLTSLPTQGVDTGAEVFSSLCIERQTPPPLHFGTIPVVSFHGPEVAAAMKKQLDKSAKLPPTQKRRKAIRLDDLLPKEDVKAGAGKPGLVFGQMSKPGSGPKQEE
jgi:hypothetical protein